MFPKLRCDSVKLEIFTRRRKNVAPRQRAQTRSFPTMHDALTVIQTPVSFPVPAPEQLPSPTSHTPALAVVGYARVSTDLQREKETIKTQVELIERFCIEKGYKLLEMICDDGVSGTLSLEQRPGGARLLELCRGGKVAGLIVYKSDRIGRDVFVNEMAVRQLHDELGIEFQGVAEKIDLSSPIGRAMFTFQSAIGRLERENTLQRSRDATIRLAREGTWLGGIVPYGFRVEGKDREARLRVADEVDPQTGMSEAEVVKMIFNWSADDGLSSIQIAGKLNALGIPTAYVRDERLVLKTGNDGVGKRKMNVSGVWRGGRVRNLLIEPVYKGLHVWGRRGNKRRKGSEKTLVERSVPAIVDVETWNGAQLTLARNSIARPDIVKRPYLLRGLMKCASCGKTFVGTVSQGKQIERLGDAEKEVSEVRGGFALRPYYMCNGKNASQRLNKEAVGSSAEPPCPSGHLRARELELLVWNEVEGFLNNPEKVISELSILLRDRLGEGVGESELFRELEELRAQAVGKDAERGALYRLFRRGTLPETDLESQLAELCEEEAAIGARLEKDERAVEKARDAKLCLEGARVLLLDLQKRVERDDSWATKRRVVEALVAGIEIETHPDASGKRGRGHTVTLRITYRFETPELGDALPHVFRTGKTPVVVLGLSLVRTHVGLNFAFDPFAVARDAARELLRQNPKMKARDVAAKVRSETGQNISPASISRLRHQLLKQNGSHMEDSHS